MKLVLFDLDDTLLAGDTEGEWVKFMIDNGMVKDASFLEKMAIFTGNYRNGRLDIYEYSNFLLGPLSGINELDLNQKVQEFSKKVVEKLVSNFTNNPNLLPEQYRTTQSELENAVDYVAGMTDRFALKEFSKL